MFLEHALIFILPTPQNYLESKYNSAYPYLNINLCNVFKKLKMTLQLKLIFNV